MLGLRLTANTPQTMQTSAQRIVALRHGMWVVEWTAIGNYIDVIAECR